MNANFPLTIEPTFNMGCSWQYVTIVSQNLDSVYVYTTYEYNSIESILICKSLSETLYTGIEY